MTKRQNTMVGAHPAEVVTEAFVDSASLHDAFAPLIIGKPQDTTDWMRQTLLECTYLLLFQNVKLVPGPGYLRSQAVPGPESRLAQRLPWLLTTVDDRPVAEAKVKRWLAHEGQPLQIAWKRTLTHPELTRWCALRRELFWETHIQSNRGLFNSEYIPRLAVVLGVAEADVKKVHALSSEPRVVQGWAKGRMDEAAQVADQAYVLSSLVRGKYHEFVARDSNLQLIAHAHRRMIGASIQNALSIPTTNSEERFVKILIGSALRESSADRRVSTWIDNLVTARTAIMNGRIDLLQAPTDADAEAKAVFAARRLELPGSPSWQRDLLSWTIGANLGLWLGFALGPWGFLASLGPLAYKLSRRRSIGEDLAIKATTDRNFARLGLSVPGRIDQVVASA